MTRPVSGDRPSNAPTVMNRLITALGIVCATVLFAVLAVPTPVLTRWSQQVGIDVNIVDLIGQVPVRDVRFIATVMCLLVVLAVVMLTVSHHRTNRRMLQETSQYADTPAGRAITDAEQLTTTSTDLESDPAKPEEADEPEDPAEPEAPTVVEGSDADLPDSAVGVSTSQDSQVEQPASVAHLARTPLDPARVERITEADVATGVGEDSSGQDMARSGPSGIDDLAVARRRREEELAEQLQERQWDRQAMIVAKRRAREAHLATVAAERQARREARQAQSQDRRHADTTVGRSRTWAELLVLSKHRDTVLRVWAPALAMTVVVFVASVLLWGFTVPTPAFYHCGTSVATPEMIKNGSMHCEPTQLFHVARATLPATLEIPQALQKHLLAAGLAGLLTAAVLWYYVVWLAGRHAALENPAVKFGRLRTTLLHGQRAEQVASLKELADLAGEQPAYAQQLADMLCDALRSTDFRPAGSVDPDRRLATRLWATLTALTAQSRVPLDIDLRGADMPKLLWPNRQLRSLNVAHATVRGRMDLSGTTISSFFDGSDLTVHLDCDLGGLGVNGSMLLQRSTFGGTVNAEALTVRGAFDASAASFLSDVLFQDAAFWTTFVMNRVKMAEGLLLGGMSVGEGLADDPGITCGFDDVDGPRTVLDTADHDPIKINWVIQFFTPPPGWDAEDDDRLTSAGSERGPQDVWQTLVREPSHRSNQGAGAAAVDLTSHNGSEEAQTDLDVRTERTIQADDITKAGQS